MFWPIGHRKFNVDFIVTRTKYNQCLHIGREILIAHETLKLKLKEWEWEEDHIIYK